MTEIKLLVTGGAGIGKSCITVRYVIDKFLEYYDPTIEDSYRKQINISTNNISRVIFADILDEAGQEEFSALRDVHIRNAQGFLLVYDITQRQSYSEIRTINNLIERSKENELFIPRVLVGNKVDIASDRTVGYIEGQNLAVTMGNIPYYEISAKTGINIDNAFKTLVLETVKLLDEKQKKEKSTIGKKKKNSCKLL